MPAPVARYLLLIVTTLSWQSVLLAQPTFQPSLKFCNRTETDVRVATAFDLSGTTEITSQGWFTVRPCTCRTVIQNVSLRATEVFALANRGGVDNVLKDARAPICLRPTQFEFRGENSGPQACGAAGGQMAKFKMYDTQGRAHRVTLRRPGQCNLMGDN